MSSTSTPFVIIGLLFWACHSWTCVGGSSGYRRILHEPFIPRSSLPPAAAPTSSSLHSQPQNQQPKRPSSNSNSSTTTTAADAAGGNNNKPFFPSVSPTSWPPPPPHSVVATFPANISSLVVPESPSSRKTSSTKFVAVAAAVVSAIALSIVALVLYYRPQRKSSGTGKGPWSDSLRLHPTDASTSDGLASAAAASNSSELPMNFIAGGDGGSKLGSPEIRPLPPLLPLPQQNLRITRSGSPTTNDEEEEEHEEEEFFSPRGSLGGGGRDGSSPSVAFHAIETLNFGSISPSESSNFVSPDRSPHGNPSPLISSSPRSLNSESSDSAIIFSAPLLPPPLFLSPSPPSAPPAKSNAPPPPPPPPPLPRFWEERVAPAVVREPNSGPPAHVAPSRPIVVPPARQLQRSGSVERTEDTPKPKLKPLHWDKVRASSDRAMVWDQLNSSSFQLNEEMIETLFVVNGSNLNQKDCHWRPAVVSMVNQENRVLDPKKSQNIAILLRALNVTIDEVCEALLEGNADALGSELLESLLKMAPTKVEEHKLKEYSDQSPFKLGPAEKFLKAVIDIPFAFKRVDSMLYIANFDSEVEYLGRAFETLEAACVELRNSKMFLKLLEAVLKTGNRMNVGTVRGDALAFKLDTLLKLVDIKGTDGKTTLLHFVVQEIIRSEGSRLSGRDAKHNENQTNDKPRRYECDLRDDVEFRKLGLQVVSSLSGELSSIKKAAAMDSDVLSSDVAALAGGISKVREARELNERALMEGSQRFSESMSGFLKKAEAEILRIQAQETTALSLVKEITEYYHGSSAKEEAHPFRIFMVVRDFLSILDHVCKEVRRINERTIVSSGRQLPQFGYPTVPPVFPGFSGRHHGGSSDEDSSSSASAS